MLSKIASEPVRTYVYGAAVPIVALLVVYGVIDGDKVADWLAVATAILMPAGAEVARSKVSPVAKTQEVDTPEQ